MTVIRVRDLVLEKTERLGAGFLTHHVREQVPPRRGANSNFWLGRWGVVPNEMYWRRNGSGFRVIVPQTVASVIREHALVIGTLQNLEGIASGSVISERRN